MVTVSEGLNSLTTSENLCCSEMWFVRDLCTSMNFAVHRVGVLHSHLLSIFLCALSDGFADCISIVFISMQVFKQCYCCFLKEKAA